MFQQLPVARMLAQSATVSKKAWFLLGLLLCKRRLERLEGGYLIRRDRAQHNYFCSPGAERRIRKPMPAQRGNYDLPWTG
jgi:hypothetical protein